MPDDKTRLDLPIELTERIRRELVELHSASPSALLLSDEEIKEAFERGALRIRELARDRLQKQVADFWAELLEKELSFIAAMDNGFLAKARQEIAANVDLWRKESGTHTEEKQKLFVANVTKRITSALEAADSEAFAALHEEEIGRRVLEEIKKNEQKILLPKSSESADEIRNWREFYRNSFGIEADFSGLSIPEPAPGFEQLIIIVGGLDLMMIKKAASKISLLIEKNYYNLGKMTHARTSKHASYAVRVCLSEGAYAKGIREMPLWPTGRIKPITVFEHLICELKNHNEKGKFLSIKRNVCCGSSLNSEQAVFIDKSYGNRFKLESSRTEGSDSLFVLTS